MRQPGDTVLIVKSLTTLSELLVSRTNHNSGENKGVSKYIMPLSRVKVAALPLTHLRLHDLGEIRPCSGKKQQVFLL